MADISALWAKTNRENISDGTYQPLHTHLIDVTACAYVLAKNWWARPTLEAFREFFDAKDHDEAARIAAFFVGLHDLGKASVEFQFQSNSPTRSMFTPHIRRLTSAGFRDLPPGRSAKTPHALATFRSLDDIVEATGLSEAVVIQLGRVVASHHGHVPARVDLGNEDDRLASPTLWPTEIDDLDTHIVHDGPEWDMARAELIGILHAVVDFPSNLSSHPTPDLKPDIALPFLSLTTVADWMGSDSTVFPFADPSTDPSDRWEWAFDRAQRRSDELRCNRWEPVEQDWNELFAVPPATFTPRHSQRLTFETVSKHLTDTVEPGCLVVIEAPTGSGKTETSFMLANHLAVKWDLSGLFVGLPLRAAANDMLDRFVQFALRASASDVPVALAHGTGGSKEARRILEHREKRKAIATAFADQLEDDQRDMPISTHGERDSQTLNMVASDFFDGRKNALISPFGIGTVDQIALSTSKVSHWFVGFGAMGKRVLILDEVHTFDDYQFAFIESQLSWAREMGATVIALSATLPDSHLRRLIQAWYGKDVPALPAKLPTPYPAVTCLPADLSVDMIVRHPIPPDGSGSAEATVTLAGNPPVFGLSPTDRKMANEVNMALMVADAIRAAEAGANVAVIVNSVKTAQELHRRVKLRGHKPILAHSRFVRSDRERIDDLITSLYGKTATNRPRGSIVISTQVIEQSLDICFDYMISEIVPIAVLVQRLGRDHRHAWNKRPPGFELPKVSVYWLNRNDFSPYPAFLLHQTWRVLERLTQESFAPGVISGIRVRDLINAVYLEDAALIDADILHYFESWQDRCAALHDAALPHALPGACRTGSGLLDHLARTSGAGRPDRIESRFSDNFTTSVLLVENKAGQLWALDGERSGHRVPLYKTLDATRVAPYLSLEDRRTVGRSVVSAPRYQIDSLPLMTGVVRLNDDERKFLRTDAEVMVRVNGPAPAFYTPETGFYVADDN
jgi:CRISPR-associated endonuclease/helicase Cas3